MKRPKKEDFEVYDKHLNNDGGAYKSLGMFSGRKYKTITNKTNKIKYS